MSAATRWDFNPDLTLTFVYHYSPLVALAAGLGFGIYFALVDTIIFRSAWPDGQKALLAEPAFTRMLLFGFRALNDELVLRLVAMTTIAALLVAMALPPQTQPDDQMSRLVYIHAQAFTAKSKHGGGPPIW